MNLVETLDMERPVGLHPLVYLVDGDEVTIGRPDTDSYGIFPPDGAELVRRLAAGATPSEAARWYEAEYGESADLNDLLAAIDELGFIRTPGDATDGRPADAASDGPVRWRRLGAALFSAPAWIIYAALVAWAAVTMVRASDTVPNWRHLFFTDYYTVIELGLFAGALPLILLHESFHALAARRLGVRSRLRISRRLYYMVLETSLDGLVVVPRRERYLPILAGMLFDVLALAALTVAADLLRTPDGGFTLAGRLCLAFAFATLLRLAWQLFFYLRTDIYVLVATLLGCVDLHTTAKRLLRQRLRRAFRRPAVGGERPDEAPSEDADWHPADRRAAGWYSWLIVAGYAFSISTFVLAVWPAVYLMLTGAVGRFAAGGSAQTQELLDSAVFLALTLGQVAITVGLFVRERRERHKSRYHHVIA